MTVVTNTLIGQATSSSEQGEDSLHTAADRLYDAECAWRNANQTHVDAWILAASDRLHAAVAGYLAVVAASGATTG